MRKYSSLLKSTNNFDLVGDKDGLKVANYPETAKYVSERIKTSLGSIPILEVCCGIGGTTIELAKNFPKVYALDIDPERIKYAKVNISRANLSEKVKFFTTDVFSRSLLKNLSSKNIHVVYTDVEWTTTGIYGQDHAKDIEKTNPNTQKLFKYLKKNFCENICMRLPKNISRKQLRKLSKCEVEEVFKNGELKFVYVYFGNLISQSSSKNQS